MSVRWVKGIMLVLIAEKIIQHVFVTLAFYFDWGRIRSTVVVNPDALMVSGGLLAVLFAAGFWGVFTGRKWGIWLVLGLALVDIVGEFAAQGRIDIVLNVSFLVAVMLIILVLFYERKAWPAGQTEGK